MTSVNIIRNIRQSLNLNYDDFALAADCALSSLYSAETGRALKVPTKIMDYVVSKGFNGNEVAEAYRKFREVQKLEIED